MAKIECAGGANAFKRASPPRECPSNVRISATIRAQAVDEMCGDVRRCADRGSESMQSELSVERSETVALLVREELARRRLSRQWLADEAKVSLSTLEKALAGRRPFTLATVVRIEDALGTALRDRRNGREEPRQFAPASM